MMNKKDLMVLGVLAGVLIAGIAMLFVQRRVPPGLDESLAPGEARRYGFDNETANGRTVVYWISLDGVRPDYLDRAHTPFFDTVMNEGAFSREHEVVFPSLTFPVHVSQATGVTVRNHGIPSNMFHDAATGRFHRYPGDSLLLEAEPIWTTATRQGIRTASYDWPLSHAQTGEHAAAFFDSAYDPGLSDEERLERLLETWGSDGDAPRPQLVMGYAAGPDRAGHRYGPESDEAVEAMEAADALLGRHYETLVAEWEQRMAPEDTLYFIVTSDHGMSGVHTLVNLSQLAGLAGDDEIRTATSGNLAHIHVENAPATPDDTRETFLAGILDRLAAFDFAEAYRREELPLEWGHDHPARTGDIVVVLESGYAFSARPEDVTGDARELDGPLGMHGYHPQDNHEMATIAFFLRHPEPLGGIDLGPVHSLQLHPTVASLLNIEPADGATRPPIRLEPSER